MFFRDYFQNSANLSSLTSKSSIRNALCKYAFVGKIKPRNYGCFGEKVSYDWIIVKENLSTFYRLLKKFEEKNPDPNTYGMRDAGEATS